MQYATVGHTDIKVSKICVGAMSFGAPDPQGHTWTLDQTETDKIVKHALDLGLNFFDTANVYSKGSSEEYLGKAIKHHVKREDVVLASKVYFNNGKLSRQAIHREIDGSLKRLGTDYLDLYIIHRFDYDTPIEETMQALHELVQTGKVRAIGASAMYGYQFQNMQHTAELNHWTKFSAMENHYNLLYREDERELIPVCKQDEVMLMPYSPLAGGRLARPDWHSSSKRSQSDKVAQQKYDRTEEQDKPIAQRVLTLAQKYEVPMSAIALAWLWHKGAAAPIVGATKARYLDEAAAALELTLSAEDIHYLEELYQPHHIVGAL